jgi:cytochrome P450
MSTVTEIMSNNLLLYGVLGALFLAYLVYAVWQWYRLSHIPGPFWISLSRFWMIQQALKKRQPFALREVNDKYGSLARVGPNELVTDDPEVVRRMTAVRSEYTRSPWWGAMRLEPGKDNLVSTRDEARHTRLRKQMAAGYSGKGNESLEGTIDEQVAAFIELINTRYVSTPDDYRPMDLAEKVQYFTLDVISALAFGRPFGHLKEDADVYDYIKIVKSFIPVLSVFGLLPWLSNLFHSRPFRRLLPKDSDKLGFGAFIGVAKSAVAERFAPSAKHQSDMLGSFIQNGLTQEEAASESLLQIFAGSDTSATTIRILLLHVLTNPHMYARLRAEIDNGISTGAISSPIKDAEGRRLPYLQALIKESLRMFPPASGYMPRTVPKKGDVIDGKFIPGGTEIGSSALALHRSKKTFGCDADIFRPERWLEAEADPARLALMTGSVDLVFHYGRYQCLGKNVAMMEFNKVFVELLRAFDFAVVRADMPLWLNNVAVWMIGDFWVRVTRRGSESVSGE